MEQKPGDDFQLYTSTLRVISETKLDCKERHKKTTRNHLIFNVFFLFFVYFPQSCSFTLLKYLYSPSRDNICHYFYFSHTMTTDYAIQHFSHNPFATSGKKKSFLRCICINSKRNVTSNSISDVFAISVSAREWETFCAI